MGAIVSRLWLMSLQACILIVIVLIARVLLKKYPKLFSYSLWALVGIRLLCPVFVESSFSLQPDFAQVSEAVWEQETVEQKTEQETKQENREEIFRSGWQDSAEDVRKVTEQDMVVADSMPQDSTDAEQPNNQVINPDMAEEMATPLVSHSLNIRNVLVLVYLSGVFIVAGSYLVRYLLMCRKLRAAVKKEEDIWLCDRVQSPFVIGVLRPRILLPYGLSEQEEQYILLHERAHVRHHDSLIRGIGILCLCLHWWNPFVWVAVHCMSKDMEMFCDEAALKEADAKERKAYAETLLNFAVRQSGFSVGLAFGESNAEQRIKNIVKNKKRSRIILGIVVVVALACGVAFLTIPKQETDGELKSGEITVTPELTPAEEPELTVTPEQSPTPTVIVQRKQAHVFAKNEVLATNPVPDYYTLDTLMEFGTVRTVKGILPGAAPGTWYIAENRGVIYYWGCLEGESTEKAELYSYAIFSEEYPLANGIKVGMSKEEILNMYPDMAVVDLKGESYEEDPAWNLGFDSACYPRSYSGDDENLNYQGKKYWHWQDQFDYCLLAEIDGETRQGRAMALALMMRNDKVEAITFYCTNDGAVTPEDWTISMSTPWERKNAEQPMIPVVSYLLDKEPEVGSKEEQLLSGYQKFLYDGMQILSGPFAICDVDFDGSDEVIFAIWGPTEEDAFYDFSQSAHIREFTSNTSGDIGDIDDVLEAMRGELSATSLGFKFFENGIVASGATHNHSYAAQDGRGLWPYTLYQYDSTTDTYELLVEVSAWDKYYHSYEFPEEADLDGDGLVYCFTTDGSWQDGAAYEAWFSGIFDGLAELEIPYQEYTVENIENLLKN